MANAKKSLTADLDWYLVSVVRLKRIGAAILVLLLGLGVYWYLHQQRTDPRLRAQSAISDATSSLNALADSKELSSFRSEFDRAAAKLAEAREQFRTQHFPDAESAAIESQAISRAALARQFGERESDAQFLSVEGDVQYQKAGSDWRKADARSPLFNGDWVKTGSNASAELIFSNGSLYTVGPNALLEIYAIVNPGTTRKQNSIQMQVGSVEINTTDDVSTVRTPGTQVVVASESVAQVGVDADDRSTQVMNLRGSASIAGAPGSTPIELVSGEAIRSSADGEVSAKRAFIAPPALASPNDNQVIRGNGQTRIDLSWAPAARAREYILQVSRSRFFAGLEIDARRSENNASAMVTTEGTFYWRVAAVDANGEAGAFSPFRRFRVVGLSTAQGAGPGDRTPPALRVKTPFHIGGPYYLIEGQVDPGATVFVNNEDVDVQPDGEFKKLVSFAGTGWNSVVVKAVDTSGNETSRSERVFVKE